MVDKKEAIKSALQQTNKKVQESDRILGKDLAKAEEYKKNNYNAVWPQDPRNKEVEAMYKSMVNIAYRHAEDRDAILNTDVMKSIKANTK